MGRIDFIATLDSLASGLNKRDGYEYTECVEIRNNEHL